MQIHTILFKDFRHKSDLIIWLKENVEPEHIERYDTEKKLVFTTGIPLSPNMLTRMARENIYTAYSVHTL